MIERYNWTAQDEFVEHQLDDLGYDTDSFNFQLTDWLIGITQNVPIGSLN